MDTGGEKFNILVVGATGKLGSLITKHCLTKPNIIVNILVRNPDKNKELVTNVEKAGGKVIQADLSKPETLKGVTKGMHTIIFAVSGEEHIMIDGQMAVINDGVANGVQRVIPTEYSENFDNFSEEEISKVPVIANRMKIRKYLDSLPLKTLRIDGAIFIESFYQLVLDKEFGYWGNPDLKYQLTSYEDTARFIAAVVAKKEQYGHKVFVANEATIAEIVETYNKVRGTNYTPKRLGSLDDLDAKAKELEEKNDPMAWLLRFSRLFSDERSRFEKIDNNEFPEVKGTSIEEFLKQRPDVQV